MKVKKLQSSTKNFPSINIVTTNLNMGSFLQATVDSILNQDYPQLDYRIVDAGSTDNSIDVIKRNQQSLFSWEQIKGIGQYDAIIHGFDQSNSEIMGWLNSDDLYFPWTLRAVGHIFDNFPEVKWISSKFHGWVSHTSAAGGVNPVNGYSKESYAAGLHCLGHPNFEYVVQQESNFWRRTLWDEVKNSGIKKYSYAGDYALWLDFLDHAQPFNIEFPLASFRFRSGQRSDSINKYIDESLSAQKEFLNNTDINFSCVKARPTIWSKLFSTPQRLTKSMNISCKNIKEIESEWVLKTNEFELPLQNGPLL